MTRSPADPWPEVACCLGPWVGEPPPCQCGPDERVLRAYIAGRLFGAPMTESQRAWCIAEFARVEGNTPGMVEALGDRDLARAVLGAWLDEARDKGML